MYQLLPRPPVDVVPKQLDILGVNQERFGFWTRSPRLNPRGGWRSMWMRMCGVGECGCLVGCVFLGEFSGRVDVTGVGQRGAYVYVVLLFPTTALILSYLFLYRISRYHWLGI